MKAFQFRLFLASRLPLAFIAGIRLKKLNAELSVCQLKERWINRNPFSSMYFAAMQMAAELCTGSLLFQYMKPKPFGMLLISNSAQYHKKAKGRILFSCKEGHKVNAALEEMRVSDEAVHLELSVEANDEQGELLAEFKFEWSLKKKT